MRKILYIFLFFKGTLHFAQGTSVNRFEESEKDNNSVESRTGNQDQWQVSTNSAGDNGGNPGDPLPIDDYIPLLVLTALGIIIYKTRKNRNLLS